MVRKNLDLTGWQILLADDNEVYVLFMQMYLERCGAAIKVVKSGSAAIEAVKSHTFDAIIYDFELSPKSGFEFLEELSELPNQPPVIGVTSQDYRGRALNAGLMGIVSRQHQIVEIPELLYNLKMRLVL
ncbi:MAG: response regulator [Schleiferiaceae bacterium]|nr:response regulator [Schleiferiaceae bacterium]